LMGREEKRSLGMTRFDGSGRKARALGMTRFEESGRENAGSQDDQA
jgi:hypothetical protein